MYNRREPVGTRMSGRTPRSLHPSLPGSDVNAGGTRYGTNSTIRRTETPIFLQERESAATVSH